MIILKHLLKEKNTCVCKFASVESKKKWILVKWMVKLDLKWMVTFYLFIL